MSYPGGKHEIKHEMSIELIPKYEFYAFGEGVFENHFFFATQLH